MLALLLAAAAPAQAANSRAANTAKQAALKSQQEDLRSRLESLQRDLASSEASRSEAADQLRGIETAISDANRRLRTLAERRTAARGELAALGAQARQINGQIAAQQQDLSDLLYRQYLHGENDALQLLLSGRDPNETARDLHFLELLSQAKAEMIGHLRASLAEKERLSAAVRAKEQELAGIERTLQQQRGELVDRQRQRQALLAQISDRVKAQRREIDTLQRNDQRLAKLIADLGKIIARQAKKHPKKKPHHGSKGAPPAEPQTPDYEPAASGAFARLRGRLPLPVHGDVEGRFGSRHGDGGAIWKGIFIRAVEGSEVRAVADGQVVYADWLRGFGNLLIVDHGDAFMSVYGNNQALLRQVGDLVKAGEAVAIVGSSGGNPDSGLYFELRHQGRPFDPLRWVSAR